MSSKINVIGIVAGHLQTLKAVGNNKLSYQDFFTFFFLPALAAAFGCWFDFKLSDELTSLLVNFGAIFTALLLSVLVLVYDQGAKLQEKVENGIAGPIIKVKQALLEELYFNICYSIVLSITLVFLCLVEKVSRGHLQPLVVKIWQLDINFDVWLFSPLVVFLTLHLLLTILMIVKRMHTLLTTK